MRTTSFSLFFLAALLLNPLCNDSGTSSNSSARTTPIEITLKQGSAYTLTEEQLRVEFLATTVEDSRCPSDVVCVWAGMGTIHLSLAGQQGTVQDFSLTIPGLVKTPYNNSPRDTLGFRFVLRQLDPYPSQGDRTEKTYEALLQIQRLE